MQKYLSVAAQEVIHISTTSNYYFLYLYIYKKIKIVVVGTVDMWISPLPPLISMENRMAFRQPPEPFCSKL